MRLHMESLEAAMLSDEVRDLLNNLSDNIDMIYDDIIDRIEQQISTRRSLAVKTISWVAAAARPLSMEELQHALAVEAGEVAFRPGRKPLIDDILGFCCGLIVIGQSSTAQLVHHTAKTYISNSARARGLLRDSHAMMASICATYICIRRLEMPDCPIRQISWATDLYDDPDAYSETQIFDMQRSSSNPQFYRETGKPLSFWTKIRTYPLVRYSAIYLGHHLRSMAEPQSDEALRAIELAKRVLRERPERNFYKRLLSHADAYPPTPMDSAFLGHYSADSDNGDNYCFADEDTEIGTNTDPDSRTLTIMAPSEPEGERPAYRETTPLHLAAQIGIPTMVQAFLGDLKMLQAEDKYGLTPLVVALQCGHSDSATMLLDAGARIDIRSKTGRMTLLFMAQSADGHEGLVANVLDRAAHCSIQPSTRTSGRVVEPWVWLAAWVASLFATVMTSIVSITQVSQIQAKNSGKADSSQEMPWAGCEDDYLKLTSAANRGDCDTISALINTKRILVKKQLNKTALRNLAILALFLAVEGCHTDVVRMLVENGVGANSRDYNGNTPLHRAAVRKNAEMVRVLLDLKADLWIENRWQYTPLDVAARSQCYEGSAALDRGLSPFWFQGR